MNILEEKIMENKSYRDVQWYTYHYHINNRIVVCNEYLIELFNNEVINEKDLINLYKDESFFNDFAKSIGYSNRWEIEEAYERLFIVLEYFGVDYEWRIKYRTSI